MRALLLYNPTATTTTAATTRRVTATLAAQLKLDVEATQRREHASSLAAAAVHDGYEVVIAMGGDGTVNEVVQGLAGTDVPLAIIPGGSTNVWARSLGLPAGADRATAALLAGLRGHQTRRVSLGLANGRWFTVSAGFGYDAEVVRLVESRRRMKRAMRQATFVWCGLLAQRDPRIRWAEITVRAHGGSGLETVATFRAAAACNSDPYSYLWRWGSRLCPAADVEGDLDLSALRSLRLGDLLRVLRAALSGEGVTSPELVDSWHGQVGYTLTSPVALPVHVDGETVEPTRSLELRSVRRALTVVV